MRYNDAERWYDDEPGTFNGIIGKYSHKSGYDELKGDGRPVAAHVDVAQRHVLAHGKYARS